MEPTDLIDEARDSCDRIATVGALLRAVGTPGDVDVETIKYSGHMIEQEAARLHASMNSLQAWMTEHLAPEQEE